MGNDISISTKNRDFVECLLIMKQQTKKCVLLCYIGAETTALKIVFEPNTKQFTWEINNKIRFCRRKTHFKDVSVADLVAILDCLDTRVTKYRFPECNSTMNRNPLFLSQTVSDHFY